MHRIQRCACIASAHFKPFEVAAVPHLDCGAYNLIGGHVVGGLEEVEHPSTWSLSIGVSPRLVIPSILATAESTPL